MSIKDRWHKWLAEYRRRQAINNRPVRFATSAVEGFAFFGRWFAGASGIAIVLSISIMFSAYTSLTSVDADHICIASQFVSSTMREGHIAALDFMIAGILGLIAAATPRLIWVVRNVYLHDLLLEDTKPLRFSQWAATYSEKKAVIIFGLLQFFPFLIAANLFIAGIDHALGPNVTHSAAAIQSIWQGFQAVCRS